MTRLRRRLEMCRTGDAGFGLILVVASTVVLLGLLLVAASVSVNSLASSRSHTGFEAAQAVSETGVDQTLARLQVDKTYSTSPGLAVSCFASDVQEQACARNAITTYVNGGGSLQTTPQGQFAAIRPAGLQKVYSQSWVPSRTAVGAKSRLLKADYVFALYKPTNALLTQSNVSFSGSVTVSPVTAGTPTPVHSNGNINGSSSSTIAGPVTASGTYPVTGSVGSGSGAGKPMEDVVRIDPAQVYDENLTATTASYAANWYDLCPDGTVRAKATTAACTSATILAPASLTNAGQVYRGWTFKTVGGVPTWDMTFAGSTYSGVYYAYRSDAIIDGGTGAVPWNATVLAEAMPGSPVACNKVGGNISWNNTDISAYYSGLVLEAGADLRDGANNNAGTGLFAAADQIYFSTSSATLTGAVVAADQCAAPAGSPSTVQGITLKYDSTFEAPIASIIRATQWIEYVG